MIKFEIWQGLQIYRVANNDGVYTHLCHDLVYAQSIDDEYKRELKKQLEQIKEEKK